VAAALAAVAAMIAAAAATATAAAPAMTAVATATFAAVFAAAGLAFAALAAVTVVAAATAAMTAVTAVFAAVLIAERRVARGRSGRRGRGRAAEKTFQPAEEAAGLGLGGHSGARRTRIAVLAALRARALARLAALGAEIGTLATFAFALLAAGSFAFGARTVETAFATRAIAARLAGRTETFAFPGLRRDRLRALRREDVQLGLIVGRRGGGGRLAFEREELGGSGCSGGRVGARRANRSGRGSGGRGGGGRGRLGRSGGRSRRCGRRLRSGRGERVLVFARSVDDLDRGRLVGAG
jgi:hypothetical protein